MAFGDWYDRHLLPHVIDLACGMKAVREQRQQLVPRARGRVLEIGIGTGLNLCHYDPSRLDSLAGLDPATEMHPKAHRRMEKAGLSVELIPLSAESIPAEDASFDTVVCTFTLCSIPEPVRALQEMRRVLRPGGVLLFSEHGLAPDETVQRWQHRLTPTWMKIAGGCHLNRDMPALIADGGFAIRDARQQYLKGPKPLTWVTTGEAVAA